MMSEVRSGLSTAHYTTYYMYDTSEVQPSLSTAQYTTHDMYDTS